MCLRHCMHELWGVIQILQNLVQTSCQKGSWSSLKVNWPRENVCQELAIEWWCGNAWIQLLHVLIAFCSWSIGLISVRDLWLWLLWTKISRFNFDQVTIKWFILPSSPWETNLWLDSLLKFWCYISTKSVSYSWNDFMVYFTVLVPK